MRTVILFTNILYGNNYSQDVVEKESTKDKELYSDEEVEEEEEEEKEVEVEQKNVKTVGTDPPKQIVPTPWKEPEPEADEEVPDDVEIIDDEQLEEELEEEDEEEEISDVDDAELLSRLEAKYGRLPEPERPGQKHSKHDCLRVTACSCRLAVGFIILTN